MKHIAFLPANMNYQTWITRGGERSHASPPSCPHCLASPLSKWWSYALERKGGKHWRKKVGSKKSGQHSYPFQLEPWSCRVVIIHGIYRGVTLFAVHWAEISVVKQQEPNRRDVVHECLFKTCWYHTCSSYWWLFFSGSADQTLGKVGLL